MPDEEPVVSPFNEDQKLKQTISRKSRADTYDYLEKDDKGYPQTTINNLVTYLNQSPEYKDQIWYDDFYRSIFFKGQKIKDEHLTSFRLIAERESGMRRISKDMASDAILYTAKQNIRNSFIDYLDSLPEWDEVPRMQDWLARVWRHDDTYEYYDYLKAVGFSWLLALMNRTLHHGCKFDHILYFLGQEGNTGKTSSIPFLFEKFDANCVQIISTSLTSKDTIATIASGTLVVNFDEGTAFKKADSETQKTFITKQIDTFRSPYGRFDNEYPRQFVFMATSNNMEAIQDVTGSRRYWIVDCNNLADFDWIDTNRDQLLAEAYHRAKAGEAYQFPEEQQQDAVIDNHRYSDETMEGALLTFLQKHPTFCKAEIGAFFPTSLLLTDGLKVTDYRSMDFQDKMNFANTMKALHFMPAKERESKLDKSSKIVRGWKLTKKTAEMIRRNGFTHLIEEF